MPIQNTPFSELTAVFSQKRRRRTPRARWQLFPVVCCWFIFSFAAVGANATSAATPFPTLTNNDPLAVYGAAVKYRITRNGKRIGTHTVTFTEADETLNVRLESKITVTVLKVPVYRFNYVSEERYTAGKLKSITATTNENGKVKKGSLDNQTAGKSILQQANGQTREFAPILMGSNHWQPAALQETFLFNTLTGKPSKVTLKALGSSPLTLNGKKVDAQHYNYSGSIRADVWYDEQGRWLQLSFTGDDGSFIKYEITDYAAMSHN